MASLEASGHKPKLEQLENAVQVRARDKGFPLFCASFATRQEAEKTLKQLEANRALSVLRDFAAAIKVTLSELMQRYIDEVAHRHKGATSKRDGFAGSSEIEDFRFHDLRHEATSRLAESGRFSLIDIQAVTGRRDVRMLMRYSGRFRS